MQALFAHSILDPHMDAADTTGRFNIYRNNFRITLRNALRTSFPAIEKLVGEEYFSPLALEYVDCNPPRSPIMAEYGDGFADFLADFDPLKDYPYLADVARIEYARIRAYHAQDADPFALHDEDSLVGALDIVAKLHPSVTIITSAQPSLSIWRAQMDPGEAEQEGWDGETVLVWRQADRVAEMLVNQNDSLLLNHFASDRAFSTLLPSNLDLQSAGSMIARFIDFATTGIIVPVRSTPEGKLQ